jgi:hypothetical protein
VYEIDRHDRVVELVDVPQCDPGAPMPIVVADEGRVELAYVARSVRPASVEEDGVVVAVVRFERPRAHMFGPPNDEALSGHPLWGRGLRPYGAYRVERSSWIRAVVRMNAVHPRHRPERFAALTHYVFTFHDSTFECLAHGFQSETSGDDHAVTLSVRISP